LEELVEKALVLTAMHVKWQPAIVPYFAVCWPYTTYKYIIQALWYSPTDG